MTKCYTTLCYQVDPCYDAPNVFCPICKQTCKKMETEDYVNGNAMSWCPSCGEFFLCPNVENGLADGSFCDYDNRCVTILTLEEALVYAQQHGYDLDAVIIKAKKWMETKYNKSLTFDDSCFAIVGVLRITHYCDGRELTFEDEPIDIQYQELPPDTITFSQFPIHISNGHDGWDSYYKAECTVCGRKYEDKHSGD